MSIKPYFKLRFILLRYGFVCFIFVLVFYAFIQLRYSEENAVFKKSSCSNIVINNIELNCSGDPLEKWCRNQVNYCNSLVHIYDKLFAITYSVQIQPNYAKGKRIGGENLQDVFNQPEHDEYFHFEKDFLKIPCDDLSSVKKVFSNDHLSNVFNSISSSKTCSNENLNEQTTIAIQRYDYVNFYHTITDVYTVYLLCRFFQRNPKSVQILFIDAHPKGNLDIIWTKLFHSFIRLGELKNYSSIFYRELIWSQPQSRSEIDIQQYRRVAPSFLFDFREHFLTEFNVSNSKNNVVTNCQSLNIFFLVRHNYVAHPRNPSGKITRQLSNEKEILEDLNKKFSTYSNIKFHFNHFEQLNMKEQFDIISETDIFVGMHGAGLTHVLFMNSNRTLIELTTDSWTGNKHFELMASMNKVNYYPCIIENGSPTTLETIFQCIKEKISQMCP